MLSWRIVKRVDYINMPWIESFPHFVSKTMVGRWSGMVMAAIPTLWPSGASTFFWILFVYFKKCLYNCVFWMTDTNDTKGADVTSALTTFSYFKPSTFHPLPWRKGVKAWRKGGWIYLLPRLHGGDTGTPSYSHTCTQTNTFHMLLIFKDHIINS